MFGNRMRFLTCSWRFLIYNKLEQSEFKLEKILVFRNMQEKLENLFFDRSLVLSVQVVVSSSHPKHFSVIHLF